MGRWLVVYLAGRGGRGTTLRPIVLVAIPGEELRWIGRLGSRGLFDGVHSFLLNTNPDGTTRLTHNERFTGILVALFKGVTAKPRQVRRLQRGAQAPGRDHSPEVRRSHCAEGGMSMSSSVVGTGRHHRRRHPGRLRRPHRAVHPRAPGSASGAGAGTVDLGTAAILFRGPPSAPPKHMTHSSGLSTGMRRPAERGGDHRGARC